jgi:hypothetical protein
LDLAFGNLKNVSKLAAWQVSENASVCDIDIKTIILPRQARDKHRENSQKRPFFPQRKFDVGTIMNISGYENATAWEKEVCQSRRNAFLSNTWCNLTDTQNVTDGGQAAL